MPNGNMNKKRRIFSGFCLILSFFIILILSKDLFAGDAGRIQLSVGTPDPVKAGEHINFQIIVANTGDIVWEKGRYGVQVFIFDKQENYLTKTKPVMGENQIQPGSTCILYLPFKIPTVYQGGYLYRVIIANNGKRLLLSDYFSFQVTPVLPTRVRERPFQLGGNATLSYSNDSEEDWEDYTANFSLNLISRVFERSLIFNSYSTYTPDDKYEQDTILLNYYGRIVDLSIGDILPSFSSIVLDGSGVRGLWVDASYRSLGGNAIVCQSQESEEPTEDTSGIFAQYLLGGQASFKLPLSIEVKSSYLFGYDDEDSIDNTDNELTPQENRVIGGSLEWELMRDLELEGEYAKSWYIEDAREEGSREEVDDEAWKIELSREFDNLSLTGSLWRTSPDYVSLGSPSTTEDESGFNADVLYDAFAWNSISGSYEQYRDNLENDPSQGTTTIKDFMGSTSISYFDWSSLSLGYSLNKMLGDPRETVDNYTENYSLSLSNTIGEQTISLGWQGSLFKDKTRTSQDLKTRTGNISLDLIFWELLSINIGSTLSWICDLGGGSEDKSSSYSFAGSWRVIPDLLTTSFWTTYSKGKDTIGEVDNGSLDTSVEVTCYLTSDLSLSLGGEWNEYRDSIDEENNCQISGATFRAGMSF